MSDGQKEKAEETTRVFTHDSLTWHGEVFEGHGTELGGERTHPVGIDIADPRRSRLHVEISLRKPFSDSPSETDPRALPAG